MKSLFETLGLAKISFKVSIELCEQSQMRPRFRYFGKNIQFSKTTILHTS